MSLAEAMNRETAYRNIKQTVEQLFNWQNTMSAMSLPLITQRHFPNIPKSPQ